jgi:hypothetical protein
VAASYLALPIWLVFFIYSRSANVPKADTWGFVPQLIQFVQTGHFTVHELFTPYTSGRPAFERLVLLLDVRYFNFNVQLIKLLSIPVAMLEVACACIACHWAIRRASTIVVFVAAFPMALVVFSARNSENFLSEWNLMNSMAVALAFVAILLVVQGNRASTGRRAGVALIFAAAAVCAFASFTGEAGALSFFACGAVMWLADPFERWVRKLVFTGLTIGFLVPYLAGVSPSTGYATHHVGETISFAVILLAGWVVRYPHTVNLVLGIGIAEIALALAVLVIFLRDREVRRDKAMQTAIGLITFAVLSALSAATSRGRLGTMAALVPRYAVVAAPMIFGIYIAGITLYSRRRAVRGSPTPAARDRTRVVLLYGLVVPVAVLASLFSLWSDATAPPQAKYYAAMQRVACGAPSKYESAIGPFPSPRVYRKEIVQAMIELREERMSAFSTCPPLTK